MRNQVELPHVMLGDTGLRASRLGFGCSHIASMATARSPAEIRSLLDEAFDAGINFFDMADVYGQGDSERLVGRVFQGRREQVILCSKAGLTVGPRAHLLRVLKPLTRPVIRRLHGGGRGVARLREKAERKCFEPLYIKRCIEGSLRRLRTDHLDIFLLHGPGRPVLAASDLWSMLAGMQEAGKIRRLGVSCDDPDTASEWLRTGKLSCLQLPVNLLVGQAVETVLAEAAAKGVGVIAREPLAGGRLPGCAALGNFARENHSCSAAQLAFRYAAGVAERAVILAGMTSRTHLEENLRCLAYPALDNGERGRARVLVRSLGTG